jgi:hypothetical protein
MHVDEENQSSKFGEASFAFGHALVARLGSGGLDEAQHGTVQHRSVGELFVVSEPWFLAGCLKFRTLFHSSGCTLSCHCKREQNRGRCVGAEQRPVSVL